MRIIKITQEYIDRGQPRNQCACPIAMAVAADVYPLDAMVGGSTIRLIDRFPGEDGTESYKVSYYIMDDFVMRWIEKFDARKRVKPFDLVLDPANCAANRHKMEKPSIFR